MLIDLTHRKYYRPTRHFFVAGAYWLRLQWCQYAVDKELLSGIERCWEARSCL